MHKLLFAVVLSCFLPFSIATAGVNPTKPLDLKFTALDGRKVDLAQLRGKVVLIDFWATWCPPCRIIGPDIQAAYKKYHGQGLEVIGVSVDSDKQGLLNVIKKEGIPWPQYFDGQGQDNALANKFEIAQFPTLWLIDKKGMIVTTNFTDYWAVDGGIPNVTSEATTKRVDAELEKQLKAP